MVAALGRYGLLLNRSGPGLVLVTRGPELALGRKGLELRLSGLGPGLGLVLRGPAPLEGCLFRRRVFSSSKAASRLARSSLLADDALSRSPSLLVDTDLVRSTLLADTALDTVLVLSSLLKDDALTRSSLLPRTTDMSRLALFLSRFVLSATIACALAHSLSKPTALSVTSSSSVLFTSFIPPPSTTFRLRLSSIGFTGSLTRSLPPALPISALFFS